MSFPLSWPATSVPVVVFVANVLISSAVAEQIQFRLCTHASFDIERCKDSEYKDGLQQAEHPLPGNSFHTVSVEVLKRRDIDIIVRCLYRHAEQGDVSAEVCGGARCPPLSDHTKSAHIKTVSFQFTGATINHFLGWACQWSKFGDPTVNPLPPKFSYGSPPQTCGIVGENVWISGIRLYTFSYPHFCEEGVGSHETRLNGISGRACVLPK
jgi:hypothetical protein